MEREWDSAEATGILANIMSASKRIPQYSETLTPLHFATPNILLVNFPD